MLRLGGWLTASVAVRALLSVLAAVMVLCASVLRLRDATTEAFANEEVASKAAAWARLVAHEMRVTTAPQSPLLQHWQILRGREENISDIHTVWQMPAGEPAGTLLLLHGSMRSALDFWPPSQGCPRCTGLPEHCNFTLQALMRGLAVVAVTSADKSQQRSWQHIGGQFLRDMDALLARQAAARARASSTGGGSRKLHVWVPDEVYNLSMTYRALADSGDDLEGAIGVLAYDFNLRNVHAVLDLLLPRLGVAHLPLYVFGTSSGAMFAQALAASMPGRIAAMALSMQSVKRGVLTHYLEKQQRRPSRGFAALAGQLLNGLAGGLRASPTTAPASSGRSQGLPWPATFVINMYVDWDMINRTEATNKQLQDAGVPAADARVMAEPLTPLYLASRCPGEVDARTSRAIYVAFQKAGLIDGWGLLTGPIYNNDSWVDVLKRAKVPNVSRLRTSKADSPLVEEFEKLWARHKINSELAGPALDWMIANGATADSLDGSNDSGADERGGSAD